MVVEVLGIIVFFRAGGSDQGHHHEVNELVAIWAENMGTCYTDEGSAIQGKSSLILLHIPARWNSEVTTWIQVLELGRGGFFGEKAIVEDTVRAATVTALVDTSLLMLDKVGLGCRVWLLT